MKKPALCARYLYASAWFFFTACLTHASVPPGTILRPAGLQWYVRGAHNAALNEYFVVWADAGVSQIRGMRLTAEGQRHPTDPDIRGVDVTGPNIAPDIAYNSVRDEYLAVWSDGGVDNGDIQGIFLSSGGTAISGIFSIYTGPGAQTYPRLAYNATDDVYMVVWTSFVKNVGSRVVKQMVAGDSSVPTLLGAPVIMEGLPAPLHPHSAQVEWNAFTNKFLVAWTGLKRFNGLDDDMVRAQLFNGDGSAATVVLTLADENGVNDKIPSIAANSRNGEFLVSYDNGIGKTLDVWALIINSNGTTVKPPFPVATTFNIPNWRNHAAYNEIADRYLITYTQGRGCGGACDDVLGQVYAPDGTFEQLIGIANDNFLQTHGADDGFFSWDDLVPSTTEPDFFELYQVDNDDINGGIVTLARATSALLAVDAPQNGAARVVPFPVIGWAIDTAADAGTGIDAVDVWAYPQGGGAGIFLGSATLGISRPDVAGVYGNQFLPSGYRLDVTTPLANGWYTVKVFARSTVSGEFDVVVERLVGIGPDPRMNVDRPQAGAQVGWPFRVSGWAIDRAANVGTGIDAVHVWAFPDSGASPLFLGAATLGRTRADVGAIFGAQFIPSGFLLDVNKLLHVGTYELRVFARSSVTGTFSNVKVVPITVSPVPTRLVVDRPKNGASVAPPFDVSGWALNNQDPTGVGVSAIHVWAFPITGGAPTFLGLATRRLARPDVASVYGNPAFEPSGFKLTVTAPLPEGSYKLMIFAQNSITGALDATQERTVEVGPDPFMFVDTPTDGASLSLPFVVRGWAVDVAASTGTGVDAVHVWAFPIDGSPATFLGGAQLGILRPGVAALFGSSQFEPSGFELQATASLSAGGYTIVVFARSTVSGTFNNSRSINVIVP